ncbi:Hypothetical protein HVR_LOCUS1214 [uncultured virus]|nr:Hypothetical protein HVR_LOCUS1214 [uncultured virus]
MIFASRNPLYEKYKSLRAGVYTIEGIIGVGKTTLGRSLEFEQFHINFSQNMSIKDY